MPFDPVDELLNTLIARGGKWPPTSEAAVFDRIRNHRAFLEVDRSRLRVLAGWDTDRDYKVDPLAGLIADTWADHLFGEDPVITAAVVGDQAGYDHILEGIGDLTEDLQGAERANVAEGEVWWRVVRDDDIADVPILEWHGRDSVIPLWVGRRLLACALVTELETPPGGRGQVWRHLEVHVDQRVEHVLFRGSAARIGRTVPLESHPDTADLAAGLGASAGERQVWEHGLPMLMGRVLNRRGRTWRLGVSDFHPILDFLLDLNEAATIGAENVRLTAKRRIVIPESALAPAAPFSGDLVDRGDGVFTAANGRGRFDAGEDVLVTTALDAELGRGDVSPFKVLEYSFDATALIAYQRHTVETALTRVGLTPQYVGVVSGDGDGLALSGTALRLRLIPSTRAGRGKARPWDATLPRVLSLMAQLDALGLDDGGFGRAWSDPALAPSVERAESLPIDEVEEAQVESTLVTAGVKSVRQSVADQHPEWDDPAIDAEVGLIKADRPAPTSGFALGAEGLA